MRDKPLRRRLYARRNIALAMPVVNLLENRQTWRHSSPRFLFSAGARSRRTPVRGVFMCAETILGGSSQEPAGCTDLLFSTLYVELHRMAKRELARRIAPATVSVTTLLHEAYVSLAGRTEVNFPDHARFLGYAARVMRGLIIDRARNRSALKRGGAFEITTLSTQISEGRADAKQLTVLSDVLDHLAKIEPELAEVVNLKFFCGLSFSEIAALQNVVERTIQRRWEKARLYHHSQLHQSCPL